MAEEHRTLSGIAAVTAKKGGMTRSLSVWFAVLAMAGSGQCAAADNYDVLLRSFSLVEQRAALAAILRTPQDYLPRIQQSLRDYPRLLRADYAAANRAVYVAALVRDPSFAPILAKLLGDDAVIDECIYACPVIFALAIHASFAGWTLPADVDTKLDTVQDLQSAVRYMPKISLDVRRLDDVVSGPAVERERKAIDGKTEEQLIEMAGPAAPPGSPRWLAALALQASVATSKNRNELYLLAINEGRTGASHEYRGAIYQAIYRAEIARARGR